MRRSETHEDGRRSSLPFFFTWVLLPNLPFVSAWLFYCPLRIHFIACYAFVGLLLPWLGAAAAYGVFVLVFALDVVCTVLLAFDFDPSLLLGSIGNLTHLRVHADPFYATEILLGAIALLGVAYLAFRLRPRASPGQALLMVLVLSAMDAGANLAGSNSGKLQMAMAFAADEPARSAVEASGVGARFPHAAGRTLVLVMVEGLGRFKDRNLAQLVTSPLEGLARYARSDGTVEFVGSTTHAEIRELCGRRRNYPAYIESGGSACLPARLRAAGYETVAIHGFTPELFERAAWYPKIGLASMQFRDQLRLAGLQAECGSVFPGACDEDIGHYVETLLLKTRQPRLVYWLTLNSHVPARMEAGEPDVFDCADDGGPFGEDTVCLLATKWHEVMQAVGRMAARPELGHIEFLIAGDHAPPVFTRQGRAMFDADVVPWIHLRPREDPPAMAAGAQTRQATD